MMKLAITITQTDMTKTLNDLANGVRKRGGHSMSIRKKPKKVKKQIQKQGKKKQ